MERKLELAIRKYSVNPWDLDLHLATELRKRPRAPRDDRILTAIRYLSES